MILYAGRTAECKDLDVDKHLKEIEENGFTVIKSLLKTDNLQRLLQEIKSGDLNTGAGANTPRLNMGSDFIYNPFFYNLDYFKLFRSNEIDSILRYFLNDEFYRGLDGSPNYILRSMICRSSKERLPWHIDSFIPFQGKYPSTFQVVIPLEEFKSDVGPTLLVPKSHKAGEYAPQDLQSNSEVLELSANVGDVIIWDARIWHAAKENESSHTRWAVIATFTRWWIKQNYRYTEICSEIHGLDKFSDDDLIILGGASETPLNHLESVDLKGGIERINSLRERESVK